MSGKGRYSKYLRPISIFFDVLVLTVLFPCFFWELGINEFYFGLYQVGAWAVISYFFGFYEIYRFTKPIEIIAKLVRQGIIFLLVVIAFFPFSKQAVFSGQAIAEYLVTAFTLITLFKFLLFYYLRKYRIMTGSNYRNAVIVGYTPDALRLKTLFEDKTEYGYKFKGFFSDKKQNENITGKISEIEAFTLDNNIDEIYCSLNEITNLQLKRLVEFADINDKTLKFIPDTKEIFAKNLKIDYYEFFPVLSLRKTPLHEPVAKIFKRLFDILFSLFVFVFVLSWLTPLLAILIKLESPGPVFFKQGRPGIDEKEFFCYKFRSMRLNKTTEESVIKNDPRVTRIGRFIRKTSLDEMPQFLNVLKGEMSVVGPRPHLWAQNNLYSKSIKKYLVRLYVKPGITGLAQVKGYRGEISTDEDMINRIKYDVFYIENWSLLLDLKIIVQTVVNIFKGEEKAY
ncbi:undecaprenyl-phosphate glucose phosphotransferase [Flavobacterium alkalisoli]|uniref:Undecaprenyl-phosphate glucose phosphotransferase n=1 Tax=Flavobacterium alkalisoli TaxID=2602769 RepID=A0A5B9FPK6_9FLAO|nr:undecaprenyl-phosphate glucose phosphotransferase [Flavobacterium alkalisoli]QEE48755.1 undecaprenyl-phosphate glucose phosphotransferase [Flavobacterium alkalisoli]